VPDAVLDRRPGARRILAAGGEVTLGIRPEDIEDAEFVAGPGPDELLDVTVDLAEPLGAETIVHFDAGSEAPFTARLSPRTAVRAGRRVKLAVDVERLHLFDPVSGQSLRNP
jgi:multiple sugar transport system ATP-binding protein